MDKSITMTVVTKDMFLLERQKEETSLSMTSLSKENDEYQL
jgi:hypothetical protein